MKASQEEFSAYYSALMSGKVDIYNLAAVGRHTNLKRSTILDIARNYSEYSHLFRSEARHNASKVMQTIRKTHYRGYIMAPYAELEALYEDPIAHMRDKSAPNLIWVIIEPTGLVTISRKNDISVHMIADDVEWCVESSSRQAYEGVMQEIHEFLLPSKFDD